MATADPSIFNDLLQKLIGSQTNISTDEQLGTKNDITQGTTGTIGTTQNATGTTSQTQTGTADLGPLQQVFQQQQAGITPDLLKSIFFEGAKQVPGLVTANANAVGARSSDNSPLSLGLQNLDSNLASQAAQINAQMLAASGQTAAQIGQLTHGTTTTGTTQQGITGATNTNQNVNTNQVQNSTDAKDTVQRQTINAQSTALTAGAALLASLLKNGGNVGAVGDLITKLFGGGGTVGGNTGSNPFDPSAGGFLNSGGTPDIFTNPGNINADTGGAAISPPGSLNDWITDPSLGGLFGWADGGIVPTPQLSIGSGKNPTAINPAALLAGGASGTSASSSDGSAPAGNLAAVFGSLGLDQGGGSTNAPSASTGLANSNVGNAVGSTVGHAVMGTVISAALTAALGPVGGLVGGLLTKMLTPTPAPNTAPGAVGGGVSAASPTGSVSVGTATGVDSATGAPVGVSMDGPSGENSGDSTSGDTGDSGGSGDGGGYADGGMLPKQSNDKKGIRDTLMIPVSGGEYVMPSDVMKHPAVLPLLELIRNSLHTPAMAQEQTT